MTDSTEGQNSSPGPRPEETQRGVKRVTSIRNYRQAAPCASSWESMTGSDRVHYCARCNLQVYDFTDMSQQEAEQLVFQREGRSKVTFYRRSDGKFLTRDCPVGHHGKRTVFAFASLAVLIFGVLVALAFLAPKPQPQAPGKLQNNAQKAAAPKPNSVDQIKIIRLQGPDVPLKPTAAQIKMAAGIKIIRPGQGAPPKAVAVDPSKTAAIKIIRPVGTPQQQPAMMVTSPTVTTPQNTIDSQPPTVGSEALPDNAGASFPEAAGQATSPGTRHQAVGNPQPAPAATPAVPARQDSVPVPVELEQIDSGPNTDK